MIWIINIGWLCWGFLMWKLGWRTGIGDGTWVTLNELRRQKIIHIDPKTEAISPGTAPKQSIDQMIERVDSD